MSRPLIARDPVAGAIRTQTAIQEREKGDRIGDRVPWCDTEDPAQLEAFYGPFGYADHWRAVVLANCREIVRASAALDGQRLSEKRIDDLAHTHNKYLEFLTTHLEGRRLREQMAREALGR